MAASRALFHYLNYIDAYHRGRPENEQANEAES